MVKAGKPTDLEINGLHTFPLRKMEGGVVIASQDDHRLRRFGILELVHLAAKESRPTSLRGEADELWAVVEGEAAFQCVDKRIGSPSEGRRINLRISEVDLEGLFIPFGIEFSIQSEAEARLIRLATHADSKDPGDQGHQEAG